jgi:hypothetical protein
VSAGRWLEFPPLLGLLALLVGSLLFVIMSSHIAGPPPPPLVSIVIPAHNAAGTLEECVGSALDQDYDGPIEVCVYDDASSDETSTVLTKLVEARPPCSSLRSRTLVIRNAADVGTSRPHGPAFARNEAVSVSRGEYLCLLDSDDVALPCRVRLQLALALNQSDPSRVLVGGGFTRLPEGSTAAYTDWCNTVAAAELALQQWRECTVIQPTWFMARSLYDAVGGWDEVLPPFLAAELAPGPGCAAGEGKGSAATGAASDQSAGAAVEVARATRGINPESVTPVSYALGAAKEGDSGVDAMPAASACSPPVVAPAAASAIAGPGASKQTPAAPRLPATAILDTPPLRIPRAREDGGAALAAYAFRSFPEDTLFYHRALALGAALARVPQPLIVYRYSEGSQSWRIPRRLLLAVRVALFEERVLGLRRSASAVAAGSAAAKSGSKGDGRADGDSQGEAAVARESDRGAHTDGAAAESGAAATSTPAGERGSSASSCSEPSRATSASAFWDTFTIWGAGRDGKAFYGALSDAGKRRVAAFCDLDARKIGQRYPPPLAQPRPPKAPKPDKAAKAAARAAAAAMLSAEAAAAGGGASVQPAVLAGVPPAAAPQGAADGACGPAPASMDVVHSGTGASTGADAATRANGGGGAGAGHAPAAKRRRLSEAGDSCVDGAENGAACSAAGPAAGGDIVLEGCAAPSMEATSAMPLLREGAPPLSMCRTCGDAAAGPGSGGTAQRCGCKLSRSNFVSSAASGGPAATPAGSVHSSAAASARSQAAISVADAASLPPHPRGVPIVHFSAIQPPAVICVALGSGGRGDDVRRNVASVRGLVEGQTAWFFV